MVGKDKMSKSLNNDVAIKDWTKLHHPEVIRYLILTNHYRSHVQFNSRRYAEANKKVYETYKALLKVQASVTEPIDPELLQDLTAEFESYMDNDFNTVPVISMLHRLVSDLDTAPATYTAVIRKIGEVLDLFDLEPQQVLDEIKALHLQKAGITSEEISQLIAKRQDLRQRGMYDEADKIRSLLSSQGVNLSDNDATSTWEPNFA